MILSDAIGKTVDGTDLSREEAAGVMAEIMGGKATDAQMGGLLVALRMKGETVEEITGFASKMRDWATAIATSRRPLVDTCGTGGDHSGTFNISTTAAFVVAGTGVGVAKHGNRSATSRCGSADVLEALGVNINASPETVGRCIDDAGIGFLFARALHGAMKHVAGPRTELKMRSVFNLLGPLTNPAHATGQVVGVYDASRAADLAQVLSNLGSQRAFVVAGRDGLDELTLDGPTHVAEATGGQVKTYEMTAGDVGLLNAPRGAVLGGDAMENAGILRAVLDGREGPCRDIVLFNAAAGILAGDAAGDWKAAVESASCAIDSGAAKEKLDALIEASNS